MYYYIYILSLHFLKLSPKPTAKVIWVDSYWPSPKELTANLCA